MHETSIPKNAQISSLSFTEGLRKELAASYDFIAGHQLYVDLVNGKLSKQQYETFITQHIIITDWLSKRTIRLAIDDPTRNCDLLRKIANFLLDESFSNLRLLKTHIRALKLEEQTREYIGYLKEIWFNASYIKKLVTILPKLWIHNSIRQNLISDPYPHN